MSVLLLRQQPSLTTCEPITCNVNDLRWADEAETCCGRLSTWISKAERSAGQKATLWVVAFYPVSELERGLRKFSNRNFKCHCSPRSPTQSRRTATSGSVHTERVDYLVLSRHPD